MKVSHKQKIIKKQLLFQKSLTYLYGNEKINIMETPIFGVIDNNLCLIDTSKTELGAKQYATRHGYTLIGFRIGYTAFILAEKINKKWVLKDEAYKTNSKK